MSTISLLSRTVGGLYVPGRGSPVGPDPGLGSLYTLQASSHVINTSGAGNVDCSSDRLQRLMSGMTI
jgi:hypothetical protein